MLTTVFTFAAIFVFTYACMVMAACLLRLRSSPHLESNSLYIALNFAGLCRSAATSHEGADITYIRSFAVTHTPDIQMHHNSVPNMCGIYACQTCPTDGKACLLACLTNMMLKHDLLHFWLLHAALQLHATLHMRVQVISNVVCKVKAARNGYLAQQHWGEPE